MMNQTKTARLYVDTEGLHQAAHLLRKGELVAFPTETVYGLGGLATRNDTVAAIYAAKGRPAFNPLIAHVHSVEAAQKLVEWNDNAEKLASAFWPGPLTLVLPLKAGHGVSSLVTAGLETLAVRVPDSPTARALLKSVDQPIAAPSANPSGRISPTRAEHVIAGLEGRIAAVLDDGPCAVGLESTIVGLAGKPTLLRAGGVPAEAIQRALGEDLILPQAEDGITAPGQLTSHYAPGAQVRLNAPHPLGDEVYLGFGPMECDVNLSAAGDTQEAAANLFDALHQLDATGRPIAIAPIPQSGLGAAINDRLQRAAAPR